MTTKFWLEDPSVLFNQSQIMELWPRADMTQNQKLNAVTRTVILLTIVGYAFSRRYQILISGAVALAITIVVFKRSKPEAAIQEGLTILNVDKPMPKLPAPAFTEPTQENPMMNVLLPQIQDEPKRESAAPSFEPKVEADLNDKTQNFVVEQFNNDPKIKELLFSDLSDKMVFDQSMRNFYSTASTTIPNDQGAFAQFCYGEAISCKENNALACERNNYRQYPTV
jgi:hypothetical protein